MTPAAWINYFDNWSAPDDKTIDWHKDNNASRSIPLYPQREWQSLTDEEIKGHLIDWTAGWTYVDFARDIEAKLREKNEIR